MSNKDHLIVVSKVCSSIYFAWKWLFKILHKITSRSLQHQLETVLECVECVSLARDWNDTELHKQRFLNTFKDVGTSDQRASVLIWQSL